MDAIDLQNAEFDTLTKLAERWGTLKQVPVVDDDYPAYRHRYEGALRDFLAAVNANGFATPVKPEYPCHAKPQAEWCDHAGPGGFMGHTCHLVPPKSTVDPFLWNFHTAIVEKTKKPL